MARSRSEFVAWMTFAVIVAIVVVANLLADFFFFRFDLTQARQYTLSSASRDVIDRLESPMHFKLFFSQQLPIRFEAVFAYIEDFVAEYEAYGKGKIDVEIIDPSQDEALRQQAYRLGIRETEANVTERGRMELARIWFGMALIYEDRKEVFPSIGSIENFEYDITSTMVKLMRGDRPSVCFIGPALNRATGVGHDFSSDMQPLFQELDRLFEVNHVDISETGELDLSNAAALVCWGLHQYTESQLYAVDQFVLSGRPVVFLVSGVQVDPGRLTAVEIPPSPADDMFEHYGFRVKRNLVADNNCQVIKKNQDGRRILEHYPLFPVITSSMNGFDPEFEPTSLLKSQLLPWVSELELVSSGDSDSESVVRVIAQSSPQSWLQEQVFVLNPERVPGPTSFDSFCVGLELIGPQNSAFSDDLSDQASSEPHRSGSDRAHLIVLGTDHILGQYQNQSSLSWMTNTLNYLTGQDSLTAIARKENAFRPIKELSFAERRRIQWAAVSIAPALIFAFGLARFIVGRRRTFSQYRQAPPD